MLGTRKMKFHLITEILRFLSLQCCLCSIGMFCHVIKATVSVFPWDELKMVAVFLEQVLSHSYADIEQRFVQVQRTCIIYVV